jgi:DNA-binding CsgD family transcriptional regulator
MAEAIVADAGREPADVGVAVELAHHWERAGSKEDALGAWVRAGEMTAARRAFHEADTHYVRALALWPEVADPEERSGRSHERLLAAAADAARWAGRVGDAVRLVQQALTEVDSGTAPRRASELYERLGDYRWEAGSQEKSVEAYEHALRLLSAVGEPDAVEARVRAALATARLRRGHYAEGLEAAREAAALAERVHAEAERGRALNTAGVALAFLDEPEEAERSLQEAKAIAERTEHLEDLLRAYANLGLIRELAGDLHGSVEILTEGHGKAGELGLSGARQTGVLANNAAATMSLIGRWDKAVELLEDFLMEQPPIQETLYLRLTLAELYGGRGRFTDARRLLEEVRHQPTTDPRFLGPLYACEAEMHIWLGDPARAEFTVRQGFEAVRGAENDLVRLRLCAVGLRASADRCLSGSDLEGSRNRAAVWAGETRRIRGRGEVPPEIDALGRLCDAELARARGRGTPVLWSDVAQAWDDLGRLYPTAYARWRETEAAVAAGDLEAAWVAASEALAAAEQLKAEPLRAEVAALVERNRLDPGPSPSDAPARLADQYRLTRREREVLRLVLKGYTNPQIAAELVIVRGTADLHVHRILTKLGVRRRAEAIALAHRTGLAEDLDDPT